MKSFFTMCAAIGAGLVVTSFALAADVQYDLAADAPQSVANNNQPTYTRGTLTAYFADTDKKDDVKKDNKSAEESTNGDMTNAPASCGCEAPSCSSEAPSCGNEAPECGSETGCGSTCGCCNDDWCDLGIDNCWPFCCCCKPGDPCTLQKCLTPCCNDVTYGGWIGTGFYTNNDPLSFHNGDLLSFWDHPNDLNLDQAWLWLERKPNSKSCCWDWGYRFDLLYGVDAQKTQAFGNSGFPNAQGYDNSWDNGSYGWALPQAYIDLGNDKWDVKIGHFFTLVGYEVIPETGNFFYSHSYTMFNSEPFTHTGVLATYKVDDKLSVMGGWVLGWDTGFDQFGNGNAVHSGFTYQASKNAKYSYMMTGGDLGWRGDGYSHSIVADFTLSRRWEYVFQSDLLDTSSNSNATFDGLSYGTNNYLFYTINDCWKWGTRAEWWKGNNVDGRMHSFYEIATGPNYKYNANLTIRPEIKFNWCPAEQTVENAAGGQFSNVIFGMDALYTF